MKEKGAWGTERDVWAKRRGHEENGGRGGRDCKPLIIALRCTSFGAPDNGPTLLAETAESSERGSENCERVGGPAGGRRRMEVILLAGLTKPARLLQTVLAPSAS